MNPEQVMGWAILMPLLGAVGVLLTGRQPNLRETVTMVTSLVTLGLVLSVLGDLRASNPIVLNVIEVFPEFTSGQNTWEGVWLAFEVEPLGMLYALVASILWVPTSMYAIGYMRGHNEDNQTRFFACFAMAIFAALGIAFAKNLFTLFLFYEVLTLSTYPLVTHYGNAEARRAGRIYMGILLTTSVAFLLLGVLGTYYYAGTSDFALGGILQGKVQPWQAMVLLALYAFGTGKAALMPFHKWLPNAMVAPTPVSALLHAVAIVKAGVFTILKVVVYVFGINFLQEAEVVISLFQNAPAFTIETGVNTWLMYAAAFTLLSSSIIALSKDNLKARLAYSTISQLAYIVLGAAIATEAAIMGAGLHIAMHAVGKITLFFCAGAVYVALHKKKISEMHGIGRKMPFTMGAFFLGSLCIIGVPPMGGSWSKWYLAVGAIDAEQMIFVIVLMISSLLSIAYLMPVVVKAFFYEPQPDDHHDHHDDHHAPANDKGGFFGQLQEAPIFCVAPLCLTAAGCIAMFFGAPFVYDLIESITKVG